MWGKSRRMASARMRGTNSLPTSRSISASRCRERKASKAKSLGRNRKNRNNVDATDKRQLETELLKMGLAGLSANGEPSPDLIQQIAAIVNNWQPSPNRHGEWIDRHMFVRDLLAECDQDERGHMYSAIAPHFTFAPYPLARYETLMTERMAKLVSK